MKPTIKYGMIFALCWVIIKLSFLQFGLNSEEHFFITACLNILGLLLAIVFGLKKFIDTDVETDSNALRDIKNAMTSAVIYTMVVTIFMYIYYTWIDQSFFDYKIQDVERQLTEVISDPQKLKELKESNQSFEVMTAGEIFDKQMENPKLFFSPKFITTLSILGMLFLSMVYSIIVTIIFRKLFYKNR